MLIATWVLAGATAALALSVPVAWVTWLSSRRQGRKQQQREREDKFRADILQEASGKFVPQGTVILVAICGALGFAAWREGRQKPEA